MEKVLNQEEIDAMIRLARGGAVAAQVKHEEVAALWDIREAGHINREQVQALSVLNEGFARNLTHSLGAYLRVVFLATLVSVEHLPYREFLQRIPEVTYFALCKVSGAPALLQMDLAVAFALIDLMLGGEGSGEPPARNISNIEAQILETVMRIICREMQTAWQALAVEFQFDQRQEADQTPYLMQSSDKVLALSFELTVAENRGNFSLAIPAVVSNPLLRKIAAGRVQVKAQPNPENQRRLRSRLLACPMQVELITAPMSVPALELTRLSPGAVLPLGRPAGQPAVLHISGQGMFHATAARRGHLRAAQLLERIETALESGIATSPPTGSAQRDGLTHG